MATQAAPKAKGANDIGSAVIAAGAEPTVNSPSKVSGRDEAQFFDKGQREYDLEHNRQNLGMLGGVFGSGPAATNNIACFIIGLSMLGLLMTLFLPVSDPAGARTVLVGLISTATGYLFGTKTKR